MNYTVIGDNVNLASRLEALNKYYDTNIIIGENTFNLVKNDFITRLVDIVAVKGKNKGVKIYELVSESGNIDGERLKLINKFNEGVEYYNGRNWIEAQKIFALINKYLPDDKPTKNFMERCEDFIKNPPSSDWSGVFVMKEK